jgi:hypothetical protein
MFNQWSPCKYPQTPKTPKSVTVLVPSILDKGYLTWTFPARLSVLSALLAQESHVLMWFQPFRSKIGDCFIIWPTGQPLMALQEALLVVEDEGKERYWSLFKPNRRKHKSQNGLHIVSAFFLPNPYWEALVLVLLFEYFCFWY